MIGFADRPMKVACGQCIGCRLERSRQWAIRCHHEASLWENNCFITLTYNDEHLPEDRSLQLRDYQLFMKRLRKAYGPGIRFFHCGEYGERFGRPHYHAILFNLDFQDKKLWKMVNGLPLFTSGELSELWPFGYSSVGAATFSSAAYVARYIMKKQTGAGADVLKEIEDPATGAVHLRKHYEWIDPETGQVHSRRPEYVTMSRRPGIGRGWLDKYRSDVWPDDFVVIDGKKMKPPRFYDRCIELDDPDLHKAVKRKRQAGNLAHADNQTPERLAVREKVQEARLKLLPRKLD